MINYQDIYPLALEGSGLTYIGGSRIPAPNRGLLTRKRKTTQLGGNQQSLTQNQSLRIKKIYPEAGSLLSRHFHLFTSLKDHKGIVPYRSPERSGIHLNSNRLYFASVLKGAIIPTKLHLKINVSYFRLFYFPNTVPYCIIQHKKCSHPKRFKKPTLFIHFKPSKGCLVLHFVL